MFKVNLLEASHFVIFCSSLFKMQTVSTTELPSINKLVSSANRMGVNKLEAFGRSLMYNINKRGPRTEPCGTPHEIDLVTDVVSFKKTYCLRLVR